MVKRGTKVIIFLGILTLLIVPMISAGFTDWFKAIITGKAEEATTALNITIGNSLPTITRVEVIPAQTPNEGSVNYTIFIFNVTDIDGASNINVSSAQARFNRTGETTRLNTSCVNTSSGGNSINFTCNITMWYYDANGDWTINVTIKDNAGASSENSSTTFTYNLLTAMVMSPTSLNWTEFGVTDTNQGANNDPIILNNTGNDVSLNINVTGYNLQGETTDTEYIYAANFSVQDTTPGCSGTTMANATGLNVTSAILQNGNNSLNHNNATSGQEEIFFCVTAVNADLSPQSYSSAAYGSWTVKIET